MFTIKRRSLVAAAAVFALVCAVAAAGEEKLREADEDVLPKLREGYNATLAALHDISVSSSKEYLQLPWFPPIVKLSPTFVPQDPGPYFHRFIRSGEKYGWWLYRTGEDWKNGKSTDWTVTDGATSLHVTDLRERPNETKDGTAIKTARKVGIDIAAGTSLFFMGWYNGPTPAAAFESPTLTVNLTPVKVGDIEALETSYTAEGATTKYWFAPERSWLPVKVELWLVRGLTNVREFSGFEKLPNGVWFPRRVVETQFDPEKGKDEVAFKIEWKVLDVAVKPEVTDEVFSTSLENITDGFHVQDGVTAREYVAGEETEAQKKEAPAEKPAEAEPEMEKAPDDAPAGTEPEADEADE